MQPKLLTLLKTTSLLFGAIASTAAMLLAQGEGSFDLSLLYLLLIGVAPFISFLIVSALLERYTNLPRIHLIGFIIADLMLIFTVGIYAITWGDRFSPYYGFLFLVIPIYLLVGSIGLLALSSLISWFISKRG